MKDWYINQQTPFFNTNMSDVFYRELLEKFVDILTAASQENKAAQIACFNRGMLLCAVELHKQLLILSLLHT